MSYTACETHIMSPIRIPPLESLLEFMDMQEVHVGMALPSSDFLELVVRTYSQSYLQSVLLRIRPFHPKTLSQTDFFLSSKHYCNMVGELTLELHKMCSSNLKSESAPERVNLI